MTTIALNHSASLTRPGIAADNENLPRSGASGAGVQEQGSTLPIENRRDLSVTESQANAKTGAVVVDQPHEIEEAVERLNAEVSNLQRSLRFTIDKDTGRTVIKVVDRSTDEVIRQIPPEYTLEILRRMEIGAGLILNEQA